MTILKDVPIPPRKYGRSTVGADKYSLEKLAVGESVRHLVADLPLENGRQIDRVTLQSRITSCAYHMRKRTGATFTVRYIDGGVQVWRTA